MVESPYARRCHWTIYDWSEHAITVPALSGYEIWNCHFRMPPKSICVFVGRTQGQLFTLLNVGLRHFSFNYRKMHFQANSRA